MTIADTPIKDIHGAAGPADAEAFRGSNGAIYPGWLTTMASMVGLTLGPSALLVFCFGSFVGPLQSEFNWPIGSIFLGGTILAMGNVIVTLIAGPLSDRIGARRIVLWTLPFFALGVASLSMISSSIAVFYCAIGFASLLGIGGWPVTYNKATSGWFDRHLGLSLGLANAGVGIGAAALPLFVGYLIPTYGWRAAYVVLGILALVPWPICYFMLKDRTAIPSMVREVAAPAAGLTMREGSRTFDFWLIAMGFLALGVASVSAVVHFVPILVDTGMTPVQAGALQAMLGVSVIFARVFTGWLLDHVKAPVLMATLCIATGIAFFIIAAGAPYGLAPLCAVIIGFVIGAEFDVLGYLIPRYFGRRAFGAIYGLNYALFEVAGSIAVALLGISRGAYGSYAFGLTAVGAVLVAGGLVFALLGQYRFTPTAVKE